jgi:hypothetical protein
MRKAKAERRPALLSLFGGEGGESFLQIIVRMRAKMEGLRVVPVSCTSVSPRKMEW